MKLKDKAHVHCQGAFKTLTVSNKLDIDWNGRSRSYHTNININYRRKNDENTTNTFMNVCLPCNSKR